MLREPEAVVSSKTDADREERRPAGCPVDRLETAVIAVSGAMEVAAQLERLVVQSRRQRSAFALLWISVLHVEGGAGPVTPDVERQVRDEVARRASTRIRATDRLLRESERDTCILLPGGGDTAALVVAARFLRALGGPYRIGDELVRVDLHVGRAACPPGGGLASELLARVAPRE